MDATNKNKLREAFRTCLPFPSKLEPHLQGALWHVLDNPGSLIRSQIVFQMALAYGASDSQAKELATAIEYFHTASLLFDDLPSMDNALERRGVPCVHVAFGENGAILAALAFINRAYALTFRAISGYPQDQQSRALGYVEQHLGVEGLLNGQSLDLHYSGLPHDQETTQRIAFGKTVSLTRLALVTPALVGGAPAREVHLLERMAVYWGLSYQIVDDLKDVLQSTASTGKTVSRDASLDRPNSALIIGVMGAVERLTRLMHLGDRTLVRLVAGKPSLSFLSRLRRDLQEDTSQIVRDACEQEACGIATQGTECSFSS